MTKFIYKYRIAIILLSLVITAFFVFNLGKLKKDAGMEAILPTNNTDYKYYKEIEETFGSMDSIIIGVSSETTIYNENIIKAIDELSRFFEDREELDENDILSITTIDNLTSEYGELISEPLIDDIDYLTEEDYEDIKKQVKDNPLFNDQLVSPDDKHTIIIAGVPTDISLEEAKITRLYDDTVAKVDEITARYDGVSFYISGFATAKKLMSDYMLKDMRKLFPLALLAVMLILFLVLRSFRGMIMPVLVTIFSVIWTFGLKGLLNVPITITEIAIPVMLIAIGCADGVHIVSEFFHFKNKGLETKKAISETLKILKVPVILTSITTALGFLSLLTAPGVSIRNIGIFLAFGVIVAMFFSLFFVPALLSFYRKKSLITNFLNYVFKPKHAVSTDNRFFRMLTGFVTNNKAIIVIAAMLVIIISIIGIINTSLEGDPVMDFHKTDKFRIDTEHINETMGGISSLFIVVEGKDIGDGTSDTIKNPELLQKMWEIQKRAEQIDGVSFTISLADYVRHMNYLINEDEAYRRIPNKTEQVTYEIPTMVDGKEVIKEEVREVEGRRQIANLLVLYEMGGGETLDSIVTSDYSRAIINIRLRESSISKLNKIIEELQPSMDEIFDGSLASVRYSNQYVRVVVTHVVVKSQIYSLTTTLIAIALILIIIFRSFAVGIITIIPTTIAVLFNFAVMWIFKVPLDMATSIIASIGIGVGVDYSIHYFQRFKLEYSVTNDYKKAVKLALMESGRAILSNAISVGLGFSVLILSNFKAVFNLGWIISLSMFTTAINALTILPALILLFKPRIK